MLFRALATKSLLRFNRPHVKRTLHMDRKWGFGKLPLTKTDLCLDHTLPSGQSFRWFQNNEKQEWHGVVHRQFYSLRQEDEVISFRCYPATDAAVDMETLNNYFQTKYDLESMYSNWSNKGGDAKRDIKAAFAEASVHLPGLRLLRQEPHECLFSFICSQNNNIARITQMVNNFCAKYGDFIVEEENKKYYSFPTLERIRAIQETELRDLGFGYRAKYIVKAAEQVEEKGGDKWLQELRAGDREHVQCELTCLMGIGRKVADCVALFSLDKLDLVPVDTHVWQISQRYIGKLSSKSKSSAVNDEIYNEIGNFFRNKFGPLAGWAHSVLFAAELSDFRKRIAERQEALSHSSSEVKEENSSSQVKDEDVKDEGTPASKTSSNKKKRKVKEEKPVKSDVEEGTLSSSKSLSHSATTSLSSSSSLSSSQSQSSSTAPNKRIKAKDEDDDSNSSTTNCTNPNKSIEDDSKQDIVRSEASTATMKTEEIATPRSRQRSKRATQAPAEETTTSLTKSRRRSTATPKVEPSARADININDIDECCDEYCAEECVEVLRPRSARSAKRKAVEVMRRAAEECHGLEHLCTTDENDEDCEEMIRKCHTRQTRSKAAARRG